MEIEFSSDDILNYFRQKGGKIIYTELVTHFKNALSNPQTQANARVVFKNYVNQLANVINEDGKKYLILRPKYMKKLLEISDSPIIESTSPNYYDANVDGNNERNQINHYHNQEKISSLNKNGEVVDLSSNFNKIIDSNNATTTNGNITPNNESSNIITSQYNNVSPQTSCTSLPFGKFPSRTSVLPTINEIIINPVTTNSSPSSVSIALNEDDQKTLDSPPPPPRPPPRKKNSFRKTTKPITPTSVSINGHQQLPDDNIEKIECVNLVKKEIQELSRTPGRVKEHAQILDKLALDTKLPMPANNSTTSMSSISQVVNNKIRNSCHSDTDSSSVHLTDPLKKRWIIASSNCNYTEMLSLLKQDPELCRYCDCIMGYSSLHWAAKFNRPEIIKLIAGNFKVDPNIKSFSGSTPLHIAAQFKNEDIMKILIYHYGANREIRDNYGKKAHQYLEKNSNQINKESSIRDTENCSPNNNSVSNNNNNSNNTPVVMSATENLKNNLRNKLSHQSMLVRNTLRNTKAFKRRKSMNEKSKHKNNNNHSPIPS